MKWAYDLCGAEMIIQDVPVYDAVQIEQGEMLMKAAAPAGFYTAATSGVPGYVSVSAVNATVGGNQGLNALGISLEKKTTSDTPSVAAAHNLTTGAFCYVKAVINPFAVYRSMVNTTSAGTLAENQLAMTASATAASTSQLVITAVATTGMFNSQWIYFSASAGPNFGSLRKIATSASAGTVTLDAVLLAAPTSADRASLISNPGGSPNAITSDALYVAQCSTDAETAVNFRVVQNYVDRGTGLEILRESAHAGGKVNVNSSQAKITRFYQDIMCKDHVFGADL